MYLRPQSSEQFLSWISKIENVLCNTGIVTTALLPAALLSARNFSGCVENCMNVSRPQSHVDNPMTKGRVHLALRYEREGEEFLAHNYFKCDLHTRETNKTVDLRYIPPTFLADTSRKCREQSLI